MNKQVNGVIRVGDMIVCDKATNDWFKYNPDARTTVTQCTKCGLWYKPSLGHNCLRDGITKVKMSSVYGEMEGE